MRYLVKTTHVITAALIISTLSGCSKYSGKGIGNDGSIDEISGIPFNLVRPQYNLSVVANPNEDAEQKILYKLNVSYVPDPTQQYTLTLDSGLFTESDFSLEIGPLGQITSSKSAIRDQIVPTVKALGAFASNILSAKSMLLSTADQADQYEKFIGILWKDKTCSNDKGAIKIRMDKYKKAGGEKGNENILTRFHYISEGEKICFGSLSIEEKKTYTKTKEAWEEKSKEFEKKYPNNPLHEEIKNNVKEKNKEKAKTLVAKINDPNFIPSGKIPIPKPKLQELAANAEAFIDESLKKNTRWATIFKDVSIGKWKARHALYLTDLIGEREQELLLKNPKGVVLKINDPALKRYNMTLASTIGRSGAYNRFLELQKFIATVKKQKLETGTEWAADAHVKIRTERDTLVTQLHEAYKATVSLNSEIKTKPKKISALKFEDIKVTYDKDLLEKSSKSSPAYVLLLEQMKENNELNPIKTGGK